MGLLKKVYTLFVQGSRYSFNLDTFKELPLFLYDLLLGASRGPKESGLVYTDLHAHIKDDVKIGEVIDEASKRVDFLALITREVERTKDHLSLDQAIEKLEKEKIDHERIGEKLVRVKREKPFYLVKGTEVYVKENQGVVIL